MKLATVAVLALVVFAPTRITHAAPVDRELQHTLEAIHASPSDASNFEALAGWLFRHGDYPRARAAAAEAVRLDSESAGNWRLLGYVAAADDASAVADSALRRAAEIDPASQVSLADFHLARAWAGYQEALRLRGPEPDLLERLRNISAVMEISPELKALVRGGWPDEACPPHGSVPPIQLGENVSTAIIVEKKTQTVRLYGRTDDGVALLKTYPCTTGQTAGAKLERGDLRTPDGVYFFTDLLSGERLPSQYGALAMPLSYPNAWDRQAHRSGHGIWFHGSDRLASPFTPRDTEGCVLMRNDDLEELAGIVQPLTTPVLIAEEVPDRPAAEWQSLVQHAMRDADGSFSSLIAAPDYLLLLRADGDKAGYQFRSISGANLEQTVPLPRRSDWEEKLRQLRPDFPASIENVSISADGSQVTIHISGAVKPRIFRPELSRRLYLDFPGVRAPAVPQSYAGSGAVHRVRVSLASMEPPTTRVVFDLASDIGHRVESEGNEVSVFFSGESNVSPSAIRPIARTAHILE